MHKFAKVALGESVLDCAPAPEQIQEDEQQNRADCRDKKASPETSKGEAQHARQCAAKERADEADNEIGYETVIVVGDLFCDPTCQYANDNCAEDSDATHVLASGVLR
jgi:hypothetical protein